MDSANPNEPHVVAFCQSISSEPPITVPLQPIAGVPANECFSVVPEHIAAHGGKAVIGWNIWEWPGVFIEAEFHMVWEAPDQSLVDITPKPKALPSITFLPDPKKQYRGRQVDNIRKPLRNSLTLRRYLDTAHAIFLEMNKGDLADYHGEMEPSPKLIKLYQKMARLERQLIAKFG